MIVTAKWSIPPQTFTAFILIKAIFPNLNPQFQILEDNKRWKIIGSLSE